MVIGIGQIEKQADRVAGKRALQRNARQKMILALARHSFLENGYAATSMSAIAASLGGSKGTLWKHFRSKQELFAEVLDSATREYRERVSKILRPSGNLETTILEFCRSYVATLTSPDAIRLHRLVTGEVGRFPEVGAIFQERAPDATRRLLAEFFAEKLVTGELRGHGVHAMATMLISLCMGGLHQRVLWGHVIRSSAEIDEEARMIANMFMQAFGETADESVNGRKNDWPLTPPWAVIQ